MIIPLLGLASICFSQDRLQSNTSFRYLESISAADASSFGEECVFLDAAEQVCYVDFQKIRFNLKEIHVIDEKGNIVYSRNVSGLPVDTILEIDFTDFKKGKYIVELRSYINSLHKRITFS